MSAKREEVFSMTRTNRLRLADVLDGLDGDRWDAPTLCAGWTVRVLAAHLVQASLTGFGAFFVASLRFHGDTDRTVDHLARRAARRTPEELVRRLRGHAEDRSDPPRVGPCGPFADTCVHLRDIARPLGLDADVPRRHWEVLLGYLTGPDVASALVPSGRLDGLRVVDDRGTAYRDEPGGRLVEGPPEALAMAITGRRVALADLDGPGVEVLDARTT